MPENKRALKDICQKLEVIKESLKKCTNSSELEDITRKYKEIDIKNEFGHIHTPKQLLQKRQITALQKEINQQIKHLSNTYSNDSTTKNAPSSAHESILKRMLHPFNSKHQKSKNKEEHTDIVPSQKTTEQNTVAQKHAKKTSHASEKTIDNGTSQINSSSQHSADVIESHSVAPKNDVLPEVLVASTTTTKPHEMAEDSADLGSPEREKRKAQLANFHKLLENLRAKRSEYEMRYPKDNKKDTSKPYGALNELINKLSMQAESYQHATSSLQDFKNNSANFIRTARSGVLGQHRGCKQILTNILLCIATLGIGYLLAMAITKSISPLKVKTDTVERIDKLNDSLNTLAV